MSTTPSTNGDAGRLNGWKEIAAYVGKGARTVQRWEKAYGLPVHRIGREGGEIVFAFRNELDEWSRRRSGERLREPDDSAATGAETAVVTPAGAASRGSRARRIAAFAALALCLAVAWWLWLVGPGSSTASVAEAPAEWRIESGKLTVLTAGRRVLFVHDFGLPTGSPSSSADSAMRRRPFVRIADIDGDERPEVLVSLPAERREQRSFYCFESDGRLRFTDAPTGMVRFGDREYGEPWLAHAQFVTGPKSAPSLFVVFTHNLWFPTRVRRLSPAGGVASEYWSNGFVEFVDEVTWRGRRTVLVGGAGNDVRGASLALFDADHVSGRAPSATAGHACSGCPEGGPLARLTFPTLCLLRQKGGIAFVNEAWVEAGQRLTVLVCQASAAEGGDVAVYYTLDAHLALVHAEVSPEFQVVHADLERKGLLDHAFGPRDLADMFPVQGFGADGRVERLAPVAVTH